jgi:uncharacterized protein YidB (DUF937 family)
MKRAGYREAVQWIADNDDTEWVRNDKDTALGTPSVTACLVADLFGVDEERVRRDIKRRLPKELR